MSFYKFSSAAPEPPPGMKAWTPAERDALLAECAAVHEVTNTKPGAKLAADTKADNHGWNAIVRVAAAHRFSAVKAAKP